MYELKKLSKFNEYEILEIIRNLRIKQNLSAQIIL